MRVQAFARQFLVPPLLLLGAGCAQLVLPTQSPVEPAARTARLEELHRVATMADHHADVAALERYIPAVAPGVKPAAITEAARHILAAARATGLDPMLIASVITVESYFRPEVISYAGAVGLTQVLPYVGRDVAHRKGIAWEDWRTLQDPRRNVLIGAHFLRELVAMFDGDVELALAAYNMGPTLLKRRLANGWRPDGPYVNKVMATYRTLRGMELAETRWAAMAAARPAGLPLPRG